MRFPFGSGARQFFRKTARFFHTVQFIVKALASAEFRRENDVELYYTLRNARERLFNAYQYFEDFSIYNVLDFILRVIGFISAVVIPVLIFDNVMYIIAAIVILYFVFMGILGSFAIFLISFYSVVISHDKPTGFTRSHGALMIFSSTYLIISILGDVEALTSTVIGDVISDSNIIRGAIGGALIYYLIIYCLSAYADSQTVRNRITWANERRADIYNVLYIAICTLMYVIIPFILFYIVITSVWDETLYVSYLILDSIYGQVSGNEDIIGRTISKIIGSVIYRDTETDIPP